MKRGKKTFQVIMNTPTFDYITLASHLRFVEVIEGI